MFDLPVRSLPFQAAVVAMAVFLCSFLVWTAAADPVDARQSVAGRPVQDDAGRPPVADPPSDSPSTEAPKQAPPTPAAAPPRVPTTLQTRVGRQDPGKWVALTFDDGPWPTYTMQVLDILKQYDVKAVFCVVGQQVRSHPQLVREIVARGHTLCNHTMDHDTRMPERTPHEMRAQMQQTLDALAAAVPGAPVPWYRAPGGKWAPQVQETAASLGMRSLGWTVDTLDWRKPGVGKMSETVAAQLSPGGVILMHDGGGDRSQSVEMVRTLIPELLAQGYQFTVPV